MDTHRRSIVKALSWRLIATLITSAIAWFITGKLDFALKIGAIDAFLKLGAYYLHERTWSRITFGKIKGPEYEI